MSIIGKIQQFFLAGNDLVVAFNEYLATHFGKTFQVAIDWVIIGLLLVLFNTGIWEQYVSPVFMNAVRILVF